MAVTVYRSTDTSAPVMSGTVGALVNVLDKCLVAGYGSKTAAGWSKPYTGTNTAVFQQGGGTSFYLDVNDNGPGAGTAQEARVRGYEAMTAVATGTGPFPTTAQLTVGIIVRKSVSADSVARSWVIVADDRTFYLFVQAEGTTAWLCFGFGDFYSYKSSTDSFRTFIMGRATEASATLSLEKADVIDVIGNPALVGHYVARSYTGTGTSLQWVKLGDASKGNGSALSGFMTVPNVDGRVWISPTFVAQFASVVRGRMRGFMHYLHTVASFNDQDTVTGAGPYASRTFLLLKTTGNNGAYCIDITGPWDTN